MMPHLPEPVLVGAMVVDGLRYRIAWFDPPWRPPLRETLEQTMVREVREEACAHVLGCRYIGCQRVEHLDASEAACYQTRFWARVELDAFRAEHEIIARKLVSAEDFRATLFRGAEATAGRILEPGLALENELVAAAGLRAPHGASR